MSGSIKIMLAAEFDELLEKEYARGFAQGRLEATTQYESSLEEERKERRDLSARLWQALNSPSPTKEETIDAVKP